MQDARLDGHWPDLVGSSSVFMLLNVATGPVHLSLPAWPMPGDDGSCRPKHLDGIRTEKALLDVQRTRLSNNHFFLFPVEIGCAE